MNWSRSMKSLVVDDHALIREALRGVLKDLGGNIAILEAEDSHQAMAIVLKNADLGLILLREMMLSVVRLVLAGGIYIPPEILREWSPAPSPGSSRVAADTRRVITADPRLTKRQLEVLTLLRQGKSNKAICRALDLA